MARYRQQRPGGEERAGGEDFTRDLRLVGALAIGLGTMMGAGIFVLSADAANAAGPAAAVSFILAGLIMLPIAMTVSELVTAMPREGGSYHLISRTLGPAAGAVVGPANWLGLVFAGGFYLVGFAQFVTDIVALPAWAVSTGAGMLFVAINYFGAHMTGRVQTLIVALLLLTLLTFAGVGVFVVEAELHEPFAPHGWGAAVGVLGLIIVGFTGFEKISTVAEEVRNPGRNLPLAIIGSVVIATIVYAAVLFVFTGVMPQGEITADETALIDAGGHVLGGAGRALLLAGGLLATASSANAALLASSRINYAMGRDLILPNWFASIHAQHNTPHRAILVTAALSIGLALTGQAAELAEISSALFIISYALIVAGVIVMRRVRPAWYDPPFRVPLHPWLPLLGGIAALGVITTMDRTSQLAGAGLALISVAWYLVWGRRRTEVHGVLGDWVRRTHPLDALRSVVGHATEERPRSAAVLAGLGTGAAGIPLLRLAATLAPQLEAQAVVALHVRIAPGTLALHDAREAMKPLARDRRETLERAVTAARTERVPVELELEVARSVAAGILHAADLHGGIKLTLLGDDGPDLTRGLRSEIDAEVARRACTDTAILVNADAVRFEEGLRRVAILWADERNGAAALRLGAAFQRGGARLTLLQFTAEGGRGAAEGLGAADGHGADEGREAADGEGADDGRLRRLAEDAGIDAAAQAVRIQPVARSARAILDAARGSDLLVAGATPRGEGRAFGGVTGAIMREAVRPVLVAFGARRRTGAGR
jgi:basic amino acid/polyamine antiporter, APA family